VGTPSDPPAPGMVDQTPAQPSSPHAHLKRQLVGLTYGLLSASTFGVVTVVMRVGLRGGIAPSNFATLRTLVAAGVLWLLVIAVRVPFPTSKRTAQMLGVGATAYGGSVILFHMSLARLSAPAFEVCLYTYPSIVAAVVFVLWRTRHARSTIVALGLSFAGIVLLFGVPAADQSPSGLALALASAGAYAAYAILVMRVGETTHPLVGSALLLTGSIPTLAVWGTLSGELSLRLGTAAWGWVVLLGALLIPMGITGFVAAVLHLGPTRTAIISALEPVVTILVAGPALDEHLSGFQAIGAVLVIVSAALVPFGALRGVKRQRKGHS
jgi:drug/metabolite transporter (DMT)-like permease